LFIFRLEFERYQLTKTVDCNFGKTYLWGCWVKG